ncbi:MAG: metallophosphoesterase [Patescibacteria group bacterium]
MKEWIERHYERVFDAAIILLAAFLTLIAYLTYRAGGYWMVLSFLSSVGLFMLAHSIFFGPKRLTVTRYRERLVHHPGAWIRVVFLSDFHTGGFRDADWYERLAHEAQSLDPDVLFLGGDFCVDSLQHLDHLRPFERVTARLGRYFVLGNHDFLEDPVAIRDTVRSWGFVDLTNSGISLSKEGHYLQLTALDDHLFGSPIVPPFRASAELPHITIAHEPDGVMDMSSKDTDLYIAGHTHGGQVRLPVIGSLLPIPSKLGRRADCGRKMINGIRLLVSQGTGEADFRARLFCPPEIMVVEVGV